MFKVGDIVTYNRYICKIINEEENKDKGIKYLKLKPVSDESLVITVPSTNEKIGKILTKDEALDLIKKIKNIDILDLNEKTLENEYKKLLNTGNKEDLIKIIKTSYLRNDTRISNNKKACEKDLTYLKKCEDLLYTELSYSLEMTKDEVKDYIIKYCQ